MKLLKQLMQKFSLKKSHITFGPIGLKHKSSVLLKPKVDRPETTEIIDSVGKSAKNKFEPRIDLKIIQKKYRFNIYFCMLLIIKPATWSFFWMDPVR